MKSLLCCVAWPAWVWALDKDSERFKDWVHVGPGVRWVFCSYAQELATRDTVKMRRVVKSPWYQERWGDRFAFTGDQNRKTRLENTANGHRIAISADGSNTGEGGDIIVVDDPHNANEAESDQVRNGVLTWWDEVMQSRLNDQRTGAFVVIMQRVHEDDLSGHILAKNAGYTHLCLPARHERDHPHVWKRDKRKEGMLLWPERFTEESLDALAANMGEYSFAGQYQQRPAPRQGGLFKADLIEVIEALPTIEKWCRAWDLAGTEGAGAFTAGVLMGKRADGKGYVIADVRREQKSPGGVRTLIKETAALDKAEFKHVKIRLPQDPGQAGKAQAADFRKDLDGHPVKIEPVTGDKEIRATPFAVQVEGSRVFMLKADWNDAFTGELRMFPAGKYADQVDAASDAYSELISGAASKTPAFAPVGISKTSSFAETARG